LITVDETYRIVISSAIKDDSNHPYSFSSLENKQIYLPQQKQYYPALENLEWHRKEIFKR